MEKIFFSSLLFILTVAVGMIAMAAIAVVSGLLGPAGFVIAIKGIAGMTVATWFWRRYYPQLFF